MPMSMISEIYSEPMAHHGFCGTVIVQSTMASPYAQHQQHMAALLAHQQAVLAATGGGGMHGPVFQGQQHMLSNDGNQGLSDGRGAPKVWGVGHQQFPGVFLTPNLGLQNGSNFPVQVMSCSPCVLDFSVSLSVASV